MGSKALHYVICYDVVDNRRRTRIAECLEGYGDRVQDSVFEARLRSDLFRRLLAEIKKEMDPKEDNVIVYTLCGACRGRREALGRAGLRDLPGDEISFVV